MPKLLRQGITTLQDWRSRDSTNDTAKRLHRLGPDQNSEHFTSILLVTYLTTLIGYRAAYQMFKVRTCLYQDKQQHTPECRWESCGWQAYTYSCNKQQRPISGFGM